jgi:hypothetical protein
MVPLHCMITIIDNRRRHGFIALTVVWLACSNMRRGLLLSPNDDHPAHGRKIHSLR